VPINKCCRETYRLLLEELLFNIKFNKEKSVDVIIGGLEYAVSMLKDQERKDASNIGEE
jgi:hypothetical protein